jgi:hypothetical protein
MILMDRDKILFETLLNYPVMTTKQVGAKVFPGVQLKTVLKRLGKLEANGYLEKIEGLPTYDRAWMLAAKGALIVSDRLPKRRVSRFLLEHEVKLVDLRISLEDAGIAHHWIPEHEIRSSAAARYGLRNMKHRTIPDAIMVVNHRGVMKSVALELELSGKNIRRYQRTFTDYALQSEISAVWYVTESSRLAKRLEKIWNSINGKNSRVRFIWSEAHDIIKNGSEAKIFSCNNELKICDPYLKKPSDPPTDPVVRRAA